MPSLSAFADRGIVTRRVARRTDEPGFKSVRDRLDRGLAWAVGALVTDDDRALFVYEDDTWKLPGGGVEPGESRTEAVKREVREETGVRIAVDELAAVSEVTVRHDGRAATFYFGTYRGTPIETELTRDPGLAGEDIEKVAWHRSPPSDCLDGDLLERLWV